MLNRSLGHCFLFLVMMSQAFAGPDSVVIGKKGGEILQAVFQDGKYIFRVCESGSEIAPNKPCENFSKEKVFDNRAHLYASMSDALLDNYQYGELKSNHDLRKEEKELLDYAKKFGQGKIDQEELKEIRYKIEVSDAKLKKNGMSPSDFQKMSSKIEQLVAKIEAPKEHVDTDPWSEEIFEDLKYSNVFFKDDVEKFCNEKHPRTISRKEMEKMLKERIVPLVDKYGSGEEMVTISDRDSKPDLKVIDNSGCSITMYGVQKKNEFYKVKLQTSLPGQWGAVILNFVNYGSNVGWLDFLDKNGRELFLSTIYSSELFENSPLVACLDPNAEAISNKRKTCKEEEKNNKTIREMAYYENLIKEGPFKLNPKQKPVFNGERSSGKNVPSSGKVSGKTSNASKQ